MKKIINIFSLFLLSSHLFAVDSIELKSTGTATLTIPEPSGLSFTKDKTALWTLSDSNGIFYKISFDGKIISTHQTRRSDLEGIVDHSDLEAPCLIEERVRAILCLDKNFQEKKRKVIELGGGDNSGFEGISYSKNSQHFYIVNEKEPTLIVELDTNFNQIASYPFTHLKDLSDIFHDDLNDHFYILSHESKKIIKTDNKFTPLSELLIPEVKQAEGLVIDIKNKLVFIVSDKDSKFYKFNLP